MSSEEENFVVEITKILKPTEEEELDDLEHYLTSMIPLDCDYADDKIRQLFDIVRAAMIYKTIVNTRLYGEVPEAWEALNKALEALEQK